VPSRPKVSCLFDEEFFANPDMPQDVVIHPIDEQHSTAPNTPQVVLADSEPATKQPEGFAKLSDEVKLMILGAALVSNKPLTPDLPRWCNSDWPHGFRPSSGLLLVNREIGAMAAEILYKDNIFQFTPESIYSYHRVHLLPSLFAKMIGPVNAGHIRNVIASAEIALKGWNLVGEYPQGPGTMIDVHLNGNGILWNMPVWQYVNLRWEELRVHNDKQFRKADLERKILMSFSGLSDLMVVWNDITPESMSFKAQLPETLKNVHLEINVDGTSQRIMTISARTLRSWKKWEFLEELEKLEELLAQEAAEDKARGAQKRKKQNEPKWPRKEEVLDAFSDFFQYLVKER